MKYLYWNTFRNKKINPILVNMIKEHGCDVVALSEYEDNILNLLHELDKVGVNMYRTPKIICNRVVVISKFKPSEVKIYNDSLHYIILGFKNNQNDINIATFLHLKSKMNTNSVSDLLASIINLKSNLEMVEKETNNKKSFIAGDFNLNPFEEPMVGALGAHAISSRKQVNKGKRVIEGIEYSMFYNPMWNLFGDNSYPPGTYYYSSSNHLNYYWNIFDQVIIRPELIDNFSLEKLRILTKVNGESLLNRNGIPNKNKISDHLPLLFSID